MSHAVEIETEETADGAFVVRYEPLFGPVRETVFEPLDQPGDKFRRIERERDGDDWRMVGRETVARAHVDRPDE
jgi:hypothetical protein